MSEQQELSKQAAHSTLSLSRLNQRLVVFERYFIALWRKGLVTGEGEAEKEENQVAIEDEESLKGDKEKETELPESGSAVVVVEEEVKKEENVVVEKKQINSTK